MRMIRLCMILIATLFLTGLTGCASLNDMTRKVLAISVSDIEPSRKTAVTKIFEYDYATCYARTEAIVRQIPRVEIYYRDNCMIAAYCSDLCTDVVGIYFKAIDATHTQVEIASPGESAKLWVAKNVFNETVYGIEEMPKPIEL